MAWLKLECDTPDKPEVLAITAKMGWSDPDLTLGKLFKVWRWFDQHTLDGNAPCVTLALLDGLIGVTGFAQAMVSVRWLTVTPDGISLPHFEYHNGETAKKRAQGAKRSEKSRNNADSNADSVTKSSRKANLEEEKEKEGKPTSKPNSKERERATRLPPSWIAPQEFLDFLNEVRPDLDPISMQDKFRDYWIAAPDDKAFKTDWLATWRKFVRSEWKAPARGSHKSGQPEWWRSAAGIEAKARELKMWPSHPGELTPNFVARIQAKIDNGKP
jgi:hypothetical protein